jgi:hypothetical protein
MVEAVELLRRQRDQLLTKQEDQKGRAIKRERAFTPGEGTPRKFSKGPRGEKIYHLDSDSEGDIEVQTEHRSHGNK